MLQTYTARMSGRGFVMYRVVLSSSLVVLLGACSVNSSAISTGFMDPLSSASAPTAPSVPRVESVALGGEPSTPRAGKSTQVASLADQAPAGSFEKAPRGALADRDYSQTNLDLDKARDIINQYRVDHGLKPLRLSPELTAAAKAHARDLAKWDRISHYGSDGSNPWDRVKRAGYRAKLAAENVGTGQTTFPEVMKGWRDSPGHNKNLLLPDAEQMGIALVSDPKTEFKTFWTLVLGASM